MGVFNIDFNIKKTTNNAFKLNSTPYFIMRLYYIDFKKCFGLIRSESIQFTYYISQNLRHLEIKCEIEKKYKSFKLQQDVQSI